MKDKKAILAGKDTDELMEEMYRQFEEDELEESDASEEAKELGLVHRGFGRYSSKKYGKIEYQTQGGKLIPYVDPGTDAAGSNKFTGKTEKEKAEDERQKMLMKKKKRGLTDVEKAGDEPYAYTFRWNGKAGKIIFTKIEIALMKEKGLPPSKIILNRIEKKIEQKKELRKSAQEKILQRREKSILLTKLLKTYRKRGGNIKDRQKEK